MLNDVIYDLREQQDLLVKGYGQINLSTARETAIKRLERAAEALSSGDDIAWKNAYHILYGSGVLEEIIKAGVKAIDNKEGL